MAARIISAKSCQVGEWWQEACRGLPDPEQDELCPLHGRLLGIQMATDGSLDDGEVIGEVIVVGGRPIRAEDLEQEPINRAIVMDELHHWSAEEYDNAIARHFRHYPVVNEPGAYVRITDITGT